MLAGKRRCATFLDAWFKRTNLLTSSGTTSNGKIFSHPNRQDIERDFVGWRSSAEITRTYRLGNRSTVYRQAQALGLFPKRQRNVRAALERIIEQAGSVHVTAASVVAAVQAHARIGAAGHWIDLSETVNLHELFERMTQEELEEYARTGKLPGWFSRTVGATAKDGQESLSD